MNIFEDYEIRLGIYQKQILEQKAEEEQKDIRIEQLMTGLDNTKRTNIDLTDQIKNLKIQLEELKK